jgi:hypothetical protein
LKEPEEKKEEQEPRTNRLQKAAAILLLALIVFVGSDAYFNHWSIVRTLVSLNTLQLKDKSGKSWDLLVRRDFQLMKVKDVRRVVNADSLVSFDQPYRDAGFYRLYFRNSDSSSVRLQRMYQALLSVDSSQTVKHTVEDAERAYRNLQRILHAVQSIPVDSGPHRQPDTTTKISKGDLALGSGDETASVIRKIVSNPSVIIGAGIGIAASAGVDLLRGDAYIAFSKENVFRFDSIAVGSQVGLWEGSPIDILWVFAPKDTVAEEKKAGNKERRDK